MTTPGIKACPFCGWNSSEVVKFTPDVEGMMGPPGPVPTFAVVCRKCEAQGPASEQYWGGEDGDPGKQQTQAILAWNACPRRGRS